MIPAIAICYDFHGMLSPRDCLDAAALCRKAVQSDFVLISVGHKYTMYKHSIEEAMDIWVMPSA